MLQAVRKQVTAMHIQAHLLAFRFCPPSALVDRLGHVHVVESVESGPVEPSVDLTKRFRGAMERGY